MQRTHLARVEKSLIWRTLETTPGNQTLAAEYLKITKRPLRHKIQTLGIDPMSFRRYALKSEPEK